MEVSSNRRGEESKILDRNIAALQRERERHSEKFSLEERMARTIASFAGSMTFVYLHVAIYGFWFLANMGWLPSVPLWDPTFHILAMLASFEAITLTTFVLINQNRDAVVAAKRADLDLQISLLAEHEVTRLLVLTAAIARKLGVASPVELELPELEKNIKPEAVLEKIEEAKDNADGSA